MLGSILAFLKFNFSKGQIQNIYGKYWLSLVIGFILAVFTTMVLSTGFSNHYFIANKPVFILSLFAFPFLDTIRVTIIRVISGKSPFLADKNHFHHKFLEAGFSHLNQHFYYYILLDYYLFFIFIV